MFKNHTKQLSTVFSKKNYLLLCALLLSVVIPLTPKIPLFEVIPGYIVRVRFEDIVILSVAIFWLIQLLRKKISVESKLTKPLIAHIITGGISVLLALFVLHTVPFEASHVLKTVLHYLRNIQYIFMFFLGFTAIKSQKDISIFISVTLFTLGIVGLYGVGQKYLQFPVYSTMNREFSAGIQLVLTEHARVQSTFGGHYDLAAYLVIMLPLVLSQALSIKKKYLKSAMWGLFILSTWLITVTAARTSFIAATIGVSLVILIYASFQDTLKQKSLFFCKNMLIVSSIFGFIFFQFGGDIRERMLHALQGYPQIYGVYRQTVNLFPRSKTDEIDNVMVSSDSQPVPKKPNDIYVDVPDLVKVATISADGTKKIIIVEAPRVYSDNALKYGLSMAIRLDTLWPQAISGFYRNPLFGSGYATLTKSEITEFTEADSTDNNFLRTLGETGLAGFITFYGSILLIVKIAYTQTKHKTPTVLKAVSIAFIAGTIGLLFNAIYIDVFVASKVALTFWLLAGMIVAIETVHRNKNGS